MTNKTAYLTTHDHISPDAALFDDLDDLRAYLADLHEEDPRRGWDRIIDTLEVHLYEGTIYADMGDGLGLAEIAHEVRIATVDEALTDANREDIEATVEELEALPALTCPVTIEGIDPEWPQLIAVDKTRRQPINAGRALEEARAYLEVAE